MTVKFYSEDGETSIELAPNYQKSTIDCWLQKDDEIPLCVSLDIEDVDEMIEVLKWLSTKVQS